MFPLATCVIPLLSTKGSVHSPLLLLLTNPFDGWGHGKKPWSPRNQPTSEGLVQKS